MARRTRNIFFGSTIRRSLQKSFGALARQVVRNSADAMVKAVRVAASTTPTGKRGGRNPQSKPISKLRSKSIAQTGLGMQTGAANGWAYHLYLPPDLKKTERLPLIVMLHGCAQNADAIAAASQMNRLAARERFVVLYPQQNQLSNSQRCWNWFDTRSGRAQRESDAILAAINLACATQPVDPARIALAGFSAGAGMAALLATRQPERFQALVMHSGVAPGVAHSATTALSAMRGRRAGGPLAVPPGTTALPALLVIQGSVDRVVACSNAASVAQRWAALANQLAYCQQDSDAESTLVAPSSVKVSAPRLVRRGKRRSATVTDYRSGGRIAATLCEIAGLGHAWSGGKRGLAYSDPNGPDASRMVWAFARRQFVSGLTRFSD
jgi:poly(hydroxyalkanoate) depolymerase family esterase